MNTRKIPALIMLLAGSAACIVTYLNHYDLREMLVVLFVVLLIFLVLGLAVKGILDSIHLPGSDAVNVDGEVIEKKEEEAVQEGAVEEGAAPTEEQAGTQAPEEAEQQ
ncbi:MAG: hypothetical protein IKS87_06970 [Lachnospiraceae bacterium]|nr:hypothetical protein [Lachnospiraceae bacterium]